MYKSTIMFVLLCTTPAIADDIMVIKAGEWSHTMSLGRGAPGSVIKTCAASDRTMTDEGLEKMMPGKKCQFTHSRAGGSVVINSVCDLGSTKINSVTTVTVLSANDYQMTSKGHISNPPQGMPAEIAMESRWTRTGPCQRGDRVMPGP